MCYTGMNKRQTCNIINPFTAKGKQYDNFDNFRKQPLKPNLGSDYHTEGAWDDGSPNEERQRQNQAVWNRKRNFELSLGQIIP